KIAKMMSPHGVYMINIIDAYESDSNAADRVREKIKDDKITDPEAKKRVERDERKRAMGYGGFLGAWGKTGELNFPHGYILGPADEPGTGLRETFVVVASKQPLDDLIKDLGSHEDDPKFFQRDQLFEPRPFGPEHRAAIDKRSRGIILTDDYAPVEN